jgi:hypothetical protein
MPQTLSWFPSELPLFLITAVATHLVMSFAQTLMHYKLGHQPIGGKFFRNHINFHHAYYSKDHLVSQMYLGDEGTHCCTSKFLRAEKCDSLELTLETHQYAVV